MIKLMFEEFTGSYQDEGSILEEYEDKREWDGYKRSVLKDIHAGIKARREERAFDRESER
jgi:hypothetical protein